MSPGLPTATAGCGLRLLGAGHQRSLAAAHTFRTVRPRRRADS